MPVAARTLRSAEGWEKFAFIHAEKIFKISAQISVHLEVWLNVFAEISVYKSVKLGHWHGGYCGLWAQLIL